MKQRITAKVAKITRYQARIDQFRQNRLFRENQSRFYDDWNGKERVDIEPDKEGFIKFWSDIWSEEAKHNDDAEWLKNLREEVRIEKQGDVVVTKEKIQMIVNKMANWKAPGPDLVQGFWLKKFSNLHDRIANQLNECLSKANVPPWMAKGRTVPIV